MDKLPKRKVLLVPTKEPIGTDADLTLADSILTLNDAKPVVN